MTVRRMWCRAAHKWLIAPGGHAGACLRCRRPLSGAEVGWRLQIVEALRP